MRNAKPILVLLAGLCYLAGSSGAQQLGGGSLSAVQPLPGNSLVSTGPSQSLGPISIANSAIRVLTGDDGWQTPAGYGTNAVFNQTSLPGGCVESHGRVDGRVALRGEPLLSNDPSAIGGIDTVLRRLDSTPPLGLGQRASVQLQMKALNLVSDGPVRAQPCDRAFDLRVNLSSRVAQKIGTMTLTRSHDDGGTFSSKFTVTPRLTFTPTDGGEPIVLDCGDSEIECSLGDGGNEITFSSDNSAWTYNDGPGGFDPSDAGLTEVPEGAKVDADGDGTLDTTLVGGSNATPGVDPVTFVAVGLDEIALLESHEVFPPQKIGPPGGDCRPKMTVSKNALGQTVVIIGNECVGIKPDLGVTRPGDNSGSLIGTTIGDGSGQTVIIGNQHAG